MKPSADYYLAIQWLERIPDLPANRIISMLPALLRPILQFLGDVTKSGIFAMALQYDSSSARLNRFRFATGHLGEFLDSESGQGIAHEIQKSYLLTEGVDPFRVSPRILSVQPDELLPPQIRRLCLLAGKHLLPRLPHLALLIEQYEQLRPPQRCAELPFGPHELLYCKAPEYLPRHSLSPEHWVAWILKPMPGTFVCTYRMQDHHSTVEHLLEWFSSQPFHDRNTNLLFGGVSGVRNGVFLLLKVLLTACYMREKPHIFDSTPDSTRQFAIRYMLEHCVQMFTYYLDSSIARLRQVEQSVAPDPCLSLIDCPAVPLDTTSPDNTCFAPVTSMLPPSCVESAGQSTNNNGKVKQIPPGQVMFREFYQKSGKPVPNHLRTWLGVEDPKLVRQSNTRPPAPSCQSSVSGVADVSGRPAQADLSELADDPVDKEKNFIFVD